MDLHPSQTRHRNSGALSGLRDWCSVAHLHELAKASKLENRWRHTPKGNNSVHLERSDQTLVDYLSEKLERSPNKYPTTNNDSYRSPSSRRNLDTKSFLDYLAKMQEDDASSTGRVENPARYLRRYSQDNRGPHDKKKKKKKKSLTTYTARSEKNNINTKLGKSYQKKLADVDVVSLPSSELESGLSLSSNSNVSLDLGMPSTKGEQSQEAKGFSLPEQYVIGRHLYNLVDNMKKSRPHPERLTLAQKLHQSKSRQKMSTFDLKNNRWKNVDAHSIRSNSILGLGKLDRSKYRHQDCAWRARRSGKSTRRKPKFEHSRSSLDSDTDESGLSHVNSPRAVPSCASRASSGKPLRTSLKTKCPGRQSYCNKRSVRFDCQPNISQNLISGEYEARDTMKYQPHDTLQWLTRSRAEHSPHLRSSLINCSNSSSSVLLSSCLARVSSSRDRQQGLSYKRLQSDNKSSRKDCSSELKSRPSRPEPENQTLKAATCSRKQRAVPGRISYTRLRNHGGSRTALINIPKSSLKRRNSPNV